MTHLVDVLCQVLIGCESAVQEKRKHIQTIYSMETFSLLYHQHCKPARMLSTFCCFQSKTYTDCCTFKEVLCKYGIAMWKGTCFKDLCFSFKPFFAYRICLFWHPHNNNRLSDRLLKDVVLSIHSFFTFWDVLIDL